jgi:hypothetical protein
MITSYKHALQVQKRRHEKRLLGVAKAVRKFVLSECPEQYRAVKDRLPARWPEPSRQKQAA